jgi:hypothetical protein
MHQDITKTAQPLYLAFRQSGLTWQRPGNEFEP